jgi:hypothetical protein
MINEETGKVICDGCGRPASYRNRPDGLSRDHVCTECAAIEHGDRIGGAFVASQMLMAAAFYALEEGHLTIDDLHTCVEAAATWDEGDDDRRMMRGFDVPNLTALQEEPREQQPWLRRLQPIQAGGE